MLNELVHSAKYIQQLRLDEHSAKPLSVADTFVASRSLRSTVGRGLIALGHRLARTNPAELPLERAA
jgi:hypothetical protein